MQQNTTKHNVTKLKVMTHIATKHNPRKRNVTQRNETLRYVFINSLLFCTVGCYRNDATGVTTVSDLEAQYVWPGCCCCLFGWSKWVFQGPCLKHSKSNNLEFCCTLNHWRRPQLHRLNCFSTRGRNRPQSDCLVGKGFDEMINVCRVRW